MEQWKHITLEMWAELTVLSASASTCVTVCVRKRVPGKHETQGWCSLQHFRFRYFQCALYFPSVIYMTITVIFDNKIFIYVIKHIKKLKN